MTFVTKRNTFTVLLCCLLIVSFIGITQALKVPTWLVSLWNWIMGLKDALEGINALISALETDIEKAKDKIAGLERRKLGHLRHRNKVKERIAADEEAEREAIKAANAAAREHSDASKRAAALRREIAALEAELRRLSASHQERADAILAELAMKNSALAAEEARMAAAQEAYDAARAKIKRLRNKLRKWRNLIHSINRDIAWCNRKIGELNAKIAKLEKRIEAEKKRRERVREQIRQEEAKYEELKKAGQQPAH
ncbi:MAG: hypothetical protein OXI43_11730 [Candidatus Poribacteria bacterium]|nr:hypothetical protein [Candidatus Poribacteria bacterium]